MKILNLSLIATTLAASFAASAAVPVNAAPMFVPQAAPLTAGIEMAAYEEAWKPIRPWLGNTTTTSSIKARHFMSAAHVSWCESHYVTYRPADNTYAPPRGPRRECMAPTG
jgi:BA14K-like protein